MLSASCYYLYTQLSSMSERLRAASSLIEFYRDQFSPHSSYLITPNLAINPTNTLKFRQSRTAMLENLLSGNPKNPEFSQALFAEQLVCFCLLPLLDQRGFYCCLAPQSLEAGGPGLKGSDLMVVRERDNQVFLSLDVKLKQERSPDKCDPYSWNHRVLSPHLKLLLGRWEVDTREGDDLHIRQWLKQIALEKIADSGKIPHIDQLRPYIVRRIFDSLLSFGNKAKTFSNTNGYLPILRTKLGALIHLFGQISTQYN